VDPRRWRGRGNVCASKRSRFFVFAKDNSKGKAAMTDWLCLRRAAITFALVFWSLTSAHAQFSGNVAARPLITGAIVETNLASLAGNVRPEANAASDLGRVPDSFPMQHMFIQLQRPAVQETALRQLIDQLHDPNSANFHQWLAPNEFGAQFGPAGSDIQQITTWLQGRGFQVNLTYPSGMTIDFSGNAGQVAAAFHTEIHNVAARGAALFANVTNPQIPAALAPAIAGIVGLNNFSPRRGYTYTHVGCPTPCYGVTPSDLATIYSFNPVFTSGNTGQNQTIYVIDDSNMYADSDWTTFRSTFGLSVHTSGTLTTIHPAPPSGPTNCTDPGINGDNFETTLDTEYSTSAAPGAAIVVASCDNSGVDGILVALQNVISAASPPAIISVSFGTCEVVNGAASNAAYNAIYQQGVTEGVSIFVSSGDNLAADCDGGVAQSGIAVNALSSTPYNVSVGGTDFSDFYSGTGTTYWNSTNSPIFGSAKSYIPEIPWNNSCGGVLRAMFNTGSPLTYGPTGFCNIGGPLNNGGGGGGPSGCATGSPSIPGVVSGTCAGYPKPSWQAGVVGIPNDGVRDLPDVSLFASNGGWFHSYIICWTDPNGGAPCTGAPSTWAEAGGTSISSPIMAGIQALVNQRAGARQGNPNYRLYQLAGKQYGVSGNASCNASNGNTVGSGCVFHDITLGDIDAPCTGSFNCYNPGGTNGVLSTSNSFYLPAYNAQTGWDFATGIGSVNVANLVMNWNVRTTHDFNGNGKSDFAWRDDIGNVWLWLMSGATPTTLGGTGGIPVEWSIVGQRDFNGDGRYDLLWRDSSGNIAIWFLNGTQVSSSQSVGNVPTTWTVVGTGDFNGDNLGDLLWEDNGGNLAVWLMNTATVISSGALGSVASRWTVVGTGDFDGDGKSDILWHDTSGNIAIWFMNGTTVASSTSVGNVGATWSVVGTGDFNGDGKSDIVWRDTGGNVAVWLMSSASVLSAGSVGNVPVVWSVAQTGDFDGDGKSDLVWRLGTANTAIWFMNGVTVSSVANVSNVPTTWTLQTANSE
jgi:Pro-kumamolisin, activation domain/FG-GAP-like repeat